MINHDPKTILESYTKVIPLIIAIIKPCYFRTLKVSRLK